MRKSTPVDVFTISSNNYLGMTRVFAESYLEHHPGATVYVCLVDTLDARVPYDEFPFEIILAHELGIPAFRNFAFRYDILELNTAVKPFVIKYLRDEVGLDRVFYFDPDILVHDRLTELEFALSEHLAVLTPHLTKPLDNVCRPPERVIGKGTVDSIQSGLFYGYLGLIEGVTRRILNELGEATVVATGGLAGAFASHTELIHHVEPDLTLHGLKILWQLNQDGSE